MAYATDEVLAGIAEITSEEAGTAAEGITRGTRFTDDLDIDSLSMMTIMTYAEEKFGVRIPDEQATSLKTVQDAVDFIAQAQEA